MLLLACITVLAMCAALIAVLLRPSICAEPIRPSTGNAMVIVEPREHAKLKYVIQNFDRVMDPTYDLYVFHGKSTGAFAKDACAEVTKRKVVLVALDTDNLTPGDYNALLKNPRFYNAIDAENILVFQTDAALCANSKFSMRHFERYGYIGCPYSGGIGKGAHWGPENSMYGVGGLSFRKKSTVAKCLANELAGNVPEDVFFSNCVEKGYGAKPEREEVMNAFCTQSVFKAPSFGMHKVNPMLNQAHRGPFLDFCPEARVFF